jgi:predicted O-methyltransferase YrrM
MNARHAFQSYFLSVDDDRAAQNFKDYAYVLEALRYAAFNEIVPDFEFANAFPGDHYRLLSGLIRTGRPRTVVDIGTYRGCSARVMLDNSFLDCAVHTFDLYDYKHFDWTVLNESDFASGRLIQHLDDLIDPGSFKKHKSLLESADFIMLDGPKDSNFEPKFLQLLTTLQPTNKSKWLFIDDIRFDNMLPLWRAIKSPKLDLSSFGHFSGSGLVNIQGGLVI